MSDPALFDETDSPPPPAYELTDQQYDQKTSHALEASLAEPSHGSTNDDLWEAWDESAFEAAAARMSISGSSSTSPNPPHHPVSDTARAKAKEAGMSSNDSEIAPLRIHKKSAQSPPSRKEKERPSWYAEAQLDRIPQSSSSQPAPSHPARGSLPSPPRRASYEREPTPPPSFEAVGPSLDGPPYEDPHAVQPGPPIVMSYSAGDSRPASPLQSPVLQPPSFGFPTNPRSHTPQPSYQHAPSAPHPMSAQPPPVPRMPVQLPVQQRSTAEFSMIGPRVPFNPQVAYNKKPRYGLPEEEPLPQKVDAASFYASAVSSYVPSRTPKAASKMPTHPPANRASTYVSPIPQRASYVPAAQQLHANSFNNYSNYSNPASYNPNPSYQSTTHQNYPSYGQQPMPTQQTYPGYNQTNCQTGYQPSWPTQPGGQPGSQFGRPW